MCQLIARDSPTTVCGFSLYYSTLSALLRVAGTLAGSDTLLLVPYTSPTRQQVTGSTQPIITIFSGQTPASQLCYFGLCRLVTQLRYVMESLPPPTLRYVQQFSTRVTGSLSLSSSRHSLFLKAQPLSAYVCHIVKHPQHSVQHFIDNIHYYDLA